MHYLYCLTNKINSTNNKPVETIPGQTGSTSSIDTKMEMVCLQ